MTLLPFAWIAVNEAIDDDGFYLEDSPKLREIERTELREMGAPDTHLIEFISILPEDRDEAMVEALVPPRFAAWAQSSSDAGGLIGPKVDNGESNLVYYTQDDEQ